MNLSIPHSLFTMLLLVIPFLSPASTLANGSNGSGTLIGESAQPEIGPFLPPIDQLLEQYDAFYESYTSIDTSEQVDEYPWILAVDDAVEDQLIALNLWDLGDLIPSSIKYHPIGKAWVISWPGLDVGLVIFGGGEITIHIPTDNGGSIWLVYLPVIGNSPATIHAIIKDKNGNILEMYILTKDGWKKLPKSKGVKV